MRPGIELLIAVIVPLLLILTKLVKYRARFFLLGLALVAVSLVHLINGTTLNEIGFRVDNLLPALAMYAAATALGILLIKLAAGFSRSIAAINWKQDRHFQYLFIPISFAQQYVCFSFTVPRLEALVPNLVAVVVLNALLFTLIHIGYGNFRKNLPLAIVAGLGFSTIYLSFPNLIASSLAHMALNLAAVYYGFFTTAGRQLKHFRPLPERNLK